jgi:hypothetical protein
LPLCDDATTIQFTGLVALHAQPVSVATSTDRRPPLAEMVSPPRLNLKVHGAGACVNPTLCEPTTIAPERGDGTGFGATTKGTAPSPWPPRSPAIETHVASVAIDHVQSRAVAMVSDPCPPVAVKEVGELLTLTWHLSEVGAVSDVVVLLHALVRYAPAATAMMAAGIW